MKFAFVYDEVENIHPLQGSPSSQDCQERHARCQPLPPVRTALAAQRARFQGLFDFDRTHAGLNRLPYTVSALGVDPDPTVDRGLV